MSFSPNLIHPDAPLLGPLQNPVFLLGTDDLGRDLLSRLLVGLGISVGIGISTAVVAVVLGTAYGLLAARFENTRLAVIDTLLMRAIDVLYSLPAIVVVIWLGLYLSPVLSPFMGTSGASITGLILAIAGFSWPDTARLVRAQAALIHREAYLEAGHTLGFSAFRLARHHILPNLMGLLRVALLLTLPRAILTESTLSFIGLGVTPPYASLGTLANDGWQLVRIAPHIMLEAALVLVLLIGAFQIISNTTAPKHLA
ncbi:MAG: ABC transporter permease [Vampirovibrionales bacterium]|nr:ABC transporter permease [Vampirovibrionales bacterium]